MTAICQNRCLGPPRSRGGAVEADERAQVVRNHAAGIRDFPRNSGSLSSGCCVTPRVLVFPDEYRVVFRQ